MRTSTLPDGLPILSRGRHRNPKRGACFMELASVLAGERWSDHPSCTHPLLAQLAPDGVLVAPVGPPGRQELLRVRAGADGWQRETLAPVSFVPLLGGVA